MFPQRPSQALVLGSYKWRSFSRIFNPYLYNVTSSYVYIGADMATDYGEKYPAEIRHRHTDEARGPGDLLRIQRSLTRHEAAPPGGRSG